ncbi:MAG: TRAP transporter large permease [Qingshengfaniella sp.]
MEQALIGFAALLLLSFIGIPLAFATLLVGLAGFALLRGLDPALSMASQQIVEITTSYNLSVIPLFVLMGSLINRARISGDLFEFSQALMGRFRGGLAMATILSCAGFSAVSGSSLATSATMTKVAMPHLRRFGYDDRLSTGALASGGTLGIMIPPSVPMVIFGLISQADIGKLFIAGILPGSLMVVLLLSAIHLTVRINPALGPSGGPASVVQILRGFLRCWPIMVLFLLVLGGIYLGIFTPTEAGAVGAGGACVFALSRGALRTIPDILETFGEALYTSARIFSIAFAALVFSNFVNLSGMPFDLVRWVMRMDLSPILLVLMIAVICMVMGTVFEAIGILVLIIPVFLPALGAAGVDLIWFGIVAILVIEIGLITPPIGMNVFTVKSMQPDVPLTSIFAGVTPFLLANLMALVFILTIPAIATWLPSMM